MTGYYDIEFLCLAGVHYFTELFNRADGAGFYLVASGTEEQIAFEL